MVLKLPPLEFTECLTDSPDFREKLRQHESELENTSNSIKTLIKKLNEVMVANKTLSKASRSVAETLKTFKFFVVGQKMSEEERDIESSLSYMGEVLHRIEEARDSLSTSSEAYLKKLDEFRKTTIGKAKTKKKEFDKSTQRYCTVMENNLKMSSKRGDLFQEADANMHMQTKRFREESLDYVFLLQQVQERKKFDFVETFLHHQVLKCRENFDCFQREGEDLKRKMLQRPEEYILKNQEFNKEGYLFLVEKKALIGTTSLTKYYCQYKKDIALLRMMNFTQTSNKQVSPGELFVRTCSMHPADEKLDKRFLFDVYAIEKGISSDKTTVFTFQAITEEDLESWISQMGGQINVSKTPSSARTEMQHELDEAGIDFIKKCIHAVEKKGLEEQGLYRVVGMTSKVHSYVLAYFDSHKTLQQKLATPVDEDNTDLKTICSGLKFYLRSLKEPLFTFKLHNRFIEAAMLDDKAERIRCIHSLLKELPKQNYELLFILMVHLSKVSRQNAKNLMTPVNLGVCFGPSLLRPEVETVSSIYDIKFRNAIVELIIIHYNKMFKSTLNTHDIEEMVGSRENGEHPVNISNSLSSLASVTRRPPADIDNVDIRRRGICSPDYNIHIENKHVFNPIYDENQRKESSSSSSLESLSSKSFSSSIGVHSLPNSSPNPSSQTRISSNQSSSSQSRQIPSENYNRLNTLSSKFEPQTPDKSSRTPLSTTSSSTNTRVLKKTVTRATTLYSCKADNETELSFNANQIITNIKSSREPGWVIGTINGQTGLIPENYINYSHIEE
ncbi:unnamed protein product [Didymodactylos carnosus]|uniref:Uncharacterized protein n=1 Tax=Didymodactylos carnosus TaxID=1234261 RepID=A0A813ZJJ7_9BILA|nr:unnamed protein product [Didymodactylos carnosus]CAF0937699.1 unnamed protein product [Didymodactylos carnosus]CAF3683679.1 unnamed protein product [Didymodactylos carnosus]CAF3713240.1 unnamed protein product [Didymodactylos carnosus]